MNPFKLPTRMLLLLMFATCSALLGFGLYLQHIVGLTPCPMCIMQRYAFMLVALLALFAGLHAPARLGQRIYLLIMGGLALTGAGIAARQSWIQLHPSPFPECGPDLAFMLDSLPLAQALPQIFKGAGDCSAVEWTFLNLSIANWSFVCFCSVIIALVWLFFRRDPAQEDAVSSVDVPAA